MSYSYSHGSPFLLQRVHFGRAPSHCVGQSTFSTYGNGDLTLAFLLLHVLQATGLTALRERPVGRAWITALPPA